jgi:signal transduction histidine kinase
MLIVDRKASFVIETRDDTKSQFNDAVGLATYSTSKGTILPYVTIFESFWRETELYEKIKEADRVKDEFVSIAAQELKTPIMPLLAGAELMRETLSKVKDKLDTTEYASLLENSSLITRNASKLHRLSEDILQVSRIEAGTFKVNSRVVDLDPLVRSVINDVERRYVGEKPEVKIVYEPARRTTINVFCDDEKISQVLFNILDNAMKFTDNGLVRVSTMVDSIDKEAIVMVRDSGNGVDPEIKPRLFEKFSSKSEGGTGLGLYLSRKIVEAHNGRIWATENKEDSGMTFGFALPLDDYQQAEKQRSFPN